VKRRAWFTVLGVALSVSLTATPVGAAAIIRHASRAAPVVALTFDDGWSPVVVRQILAILVENGVPATFFPYASAMRRSPSVWAAVAAAGYPVGNHTVSHRSLPRLPSAVIRHEICGFRAMADPVLGGPSIDWFRPPYGHWSPRVAAIAAECGYRHVLLWDVDAHDWGSTRAMTVAVRASAGENGSIVLMHAGPASTPSVLQHIIDGYRARGFEFVTVPQLLGSGADPSIAEHHDDGDGEPDGALIAERCREER
jgi:peptidoglycan/xylan/chitin deacetylase (PgdA/CDA1 family)